MLSFQDVPVVDKYTYLGVEFDYTLSFSSEPKRRLVKS